MSTSLFAVDLPAPVAETLHDVWGRVRRHLRTGAREPVVEPRAGRLTGDLWRYAVEHPFGSRPDVDPRIAAPVGVMYWLRHRFRSGGGEDLERALYMLRQVHDYDPDLLPPDAHTTLHELDDLDSDGEHFEQIGVRLLRGYTVDGDLSAIDDAVAMMRRAVAASSGNSPAAARFLTNLCGTLLMRFNLRHSNDDLSAALDAGSRATSVRATWGLGRGAALANYGVALVHAADVPTFVDHATLRTAVGHCRGAWLSTARTPSEHAAYHTTMLSVARAVFERTRDWADLEVALELTRTPAHGG